MKKRLFFFFRYLTTSRHFRLWRGRWVTTQSLMMLGISAAFMGTMAWSAPYASSEAPAADLALVQDSTATPESQPADPNATPTRVPLPPEYLTNSSQTNGITMAATLLVIIVVIGVLLFLPRRDEG